MKAFNRVNAFGRQYHFTELIDGTTSIRTSKNEIVVAHDIEKLRQSWYDWQMTGMFIQHAFEYLTADEREFLQTGLTEAKWNEIFQGVKNNEEN